MPRRKRSSLKILAEIFALIGAILLVISGLFSLIGFVLALPWMFYGKFYVFSLGRIINGLVLIFVGVIILASYDVIKLSLKTEMDWPVLLVLGIVALLFGGGLVAILIIFAALIDLLA